MSTADRMVKERVRYLGVQPRRAVGDNLDRLAQAFSRGRGQATRIGSRIERSTQLVLVHPAFQGNDADVRTQRLGIADEGDTGGLCTVMFGQAEVYEQYA
jgi:hypothetical protein